MGVVVETKFGKLQGESKDGVCVSRGVPFAKPPVGELRFRPPQPPEPWSGVRDATRLGPAAIQDQGLLTADIAEKSEDCLYLNVFTPAADAGKRPVMVWIHGGGFANGTGGQAIYDGSHLAKRGDVVVVTINYRLGAFGFLSLADALPADLPTSANAGLLDQIAALEWVRDNIAAFGGDPKRVTIFGESAGGMSVGTLLGTPKAKGLFVRAIPQSGAAHHTARREDSARAARVLLQTLGISEGQEKKLWGVPAQDILKAQRKCFTLNYDEDGSRVRHQPLLAFPFIPVLDDDVLPRDPLFAIEGGHAKDVDILIGTTLDEWMLFIQLTDTRKKTLDEEGLVKVLEKRVPGHGVKAAEHYRDVRGKRGASIKPVDLFCAVETDRTFRIPAVRLAEGQAASGGRVYNYLFTYPSPMMNGAMGSCHALEIPFVFGTIDTPFAKTFVGEGPVVEALSAKLMDTWLSFAKTGAPTLPGAGAWPTYEKETRSVMVLGERCGIERAPQDEERAFWDELL